MNELTRRATSVAAIFIVVLAGVFVLMYWWGRGQVDNAARESLKNDLRNLAAAESDYFGQHRRYTTALSQLPGFQAANAVSVELADSSSWEASARHTRTLQACTFGKGDPAVKCD
ncbi:MAG TPA: hypothetical protein VMR92_02910 [Gemmatimonadales bacterium]|nr:hypothetical protein [Gemmatimonadales bacterium]